MRARIQQGLQAMHIEFDEFIEPKTDEEYQKRVINFAQRAIESGIIKQESLELPYCNQCDLFLIDSQVDGNCPYCEKSGRGVCEQCGIVVPPHELLNVKCSRCKKPANQKITSVYTFTLSDYLHLILHDLSQHDLSPVIRQMINQVASMNDCKIILSHPDVSGQGLKLPESSQTMHVWFEMAAHYEQFALDQKYWIHCFGFDNCFYYLLFIPSLLRAMNPDAKLPDAIITNAFLQLDGLKFSTSRDHAIWADEFEGNSRSFAIIFVPASTFIICGRFYI